MKRKKTIKIECRNEQLYFDTGSTVIMGFRCTHKRTGRERLALVVNGKLVVHGRNLKIGRIFMIINDRKLLHPLSALFVPTNYQTHLTAIVFLVSAWPEFRLQSCFSFCILFTYKSMTKRSLQAKIMQSNERTLTEQWQYKRWRSMASHTTQHTWTARDPQHVRKCGKCMTKIKNFKIPVTWGSFSLFRSLNIMSTVCLSNKFWTSKNGEKGNCLA